MTGVLVIGGEGPTRRALAPYIGGASRVVAADSGLQAAVRLGLEVDLVVGDMDSIADPALLARFPPERVARYPTDKDETDTEIGLRVLFDRGCVSVVIAGGGGGSTDHFLGVLALFERPLAPAAWVTDAAAMVSLAGTCSVAVRPGETLSFFPLGREARVERSSGLRWPLDGMRFGRGQASLRNEAASGSIELEIREGGLLMVRDIRETRGGTGQA
jgi:thiamine pyrophosphokinase